MSTISIIGTGGMAVAIGGLAAKAGHTVEVMSRDALEITAREAKLPFQREHTTPFIWDQPQRFALGNVAWGNGRDLSASHRLTLDYQEDYQLIQAVFEALHRSDDKPAFTVEAIVDYLEAHPEVRALNAMHVGKSWTQAHKDELRTLASDDDGAGATS